MIGDLPDFLAVRHDLWWLEQIREPCAKLASAQDSHHLFRYTSAGYVCNAMNFACAFHIESTVKSNDKS